MKHPESFYEKQLKLITAERRALREYTQKGKTKALAARYARAARRLQDHENSF